jgi:hypothetical protein
MALPKDLAKMVTDYVVGATRPMNVIDALNHGISMLEIASQPLQASMPGIRLAPWNLEHPVRDMVSLCNEHTPYREPH